MNATATRTLISADELAAWLARTPQPVVVDTSFDLADTDAGERRYRAGEPLVRGTAADAGRGAWIMGEQ